MATLRREPDVGFRMPQAALDVLGEWKWQLDAIVEDGARFWGGGDGVEFWAVPVVKRGSPDCAPAKHVCIVAVVVDAGRGRRAVHARSRPRGEDWRLAPLLPGHAAIYGTVPDGVTGARVTIGERTGRGRRGRQRDRRRAAVPLRATARDVRVELIRRRRGRRCPLVGVVDAGGPARAVAARAARAGLPRRSTRSRRA